jgi:hypothetical protein
MQAAIDYIASLSAGNGTSGLQSLLAEFQAETIQIQTLATHAALDVAIQQLKQITSEFRSELRTQMLTYDGKLLKLENQIQTALQVDKSRLQTLEDVYWTTRETNELWIFDTRVDHAQDIITALTNHGYNTTEARAKLDEIQGKRGELEAAFQARDYDQIHVVNLQLYALSIDLRIIVKNLQIQIPLEKKVRYWISVGGHAVNRTATIISELETLGVNVTALQEIHAQAVMDLANAEELFAANDTQGALGALHDLRADFILLRDAYHILIVQGMITGDEQTKVESVTTALNDTINGMNGSIG